MTRLTLGSRKSTTEPRTPWLPRAPGPAAPPRSRGSSVRQVRSASSACGRKDVGEGGARQAFGGETCQGQCSFGRAEVLAGTER